MSDTAAAADSARISKIMGNRVKALIEKYPWLYSTKSQHTGGPDLQEVSDELEAMLTVMSLVDAPPDMTSLAMQTMLANAKEHGARQRVEMGGAKKATTADRSAKDTVLGDVKQLSRVLDFNEKGEWAFIALTSKTFRSAYMVSTAAAHGLAWGLSACKATPIRDDQMWGTECAPVVEPCGNNWQACSSEQYAFTAFSQTRNQECCPNATHQCVEDPSSKHYGTKCVPIKACAEGRAPCGRRKGAVMETPDDTCCAADEQCYIVDLPNRRYKSSCLKCDMPCGRPALKDATGDDRCCLPRQVCRPAFSGAAGTKRTECVYPFKCRKHTCKHGGKCVNGASPYVGHTGTFRKCKCKPGFKGVFCEIKANNSGFEAPWSGNVSERAAAGAASALESAKELDEKHHLREKAARAIVSFLRTANKIIKPGDREGEKGDASDPSARVGTTAQQRAAASADAKLPVATAVPI
ncbi:hypothetical protein JKP88DRAFT_353470 [Tribonema minus]|uniref:EGF-like domain-containing protein n=1 Tax=Tribonema minus TaxID=303371 RepID=A0A836CIV9_9STRA|nr:hypothetical protein JKP88DRAFT_353470 [Tribonema minus]